MRAAPAREHGGEVSGIHNLDSGAQRAEARGANLSEFDLKKGVWTVPAERMKGRNRASCPVAGARRRDSEGNDAPRGKVRWGSFSPAKEPAAR